jgi:hypothetical protein
MTEERPAFYALRGGGWRDWWSLLHPPYTLWHLSYVAFGAAAAPRVELRRLVEALIAFFLAVGIGAHALDELRGRPLKTRIPSAALWSVALASVAGAVAIGVANLRAVGGWGVPFIVFGGFIVLAYNLEWFGGRFHTDNWFAFAWGAFPALTGTWAMRGRVTLPGALVSAGCFFVSAAQRRLSTPVRALRRRTAAVGGAILRTDGTEEPITKSSLGAPLERALRALSAGIPLLAAAAVLARLG